CRRSGTRWRPASSTTVRSIRRCRSGCAARSTGCARERTAEGAATAREAADAAPARAPLAGGRRAPRRRILGCARAVVPGTAAARRTRADRRRLGRRNGGGAASGVRRAGGGRAALERRVRAPAGLVEHPAALARARLGG